MPALSVPLDGRLTSQNILAGPLDASSVMPIVSPGNAAQGNSYQVPLSTLATFFGSFGTPTLIATTYNSVASDTRILVNLSPVNPITVLMLNSSQYTQPILIKDIGGTVTAVNTVTIDFSGGQTADGQTSLTLQNAYAGIWLNPLEAGGFYLTAA